MLFLELEMQMVGASGFPIAVGNHNDSYVYGRKNPYTMQWITLSTIDFSKIIKI